MSNIKIYEKDKASKLSKNFTSNEFDCHGKGCCNKTEVDLDLIEILQKIRDHFGKSVHISSGYRCVKHNKNVGGATGSRHAKGMAADIYINGVAPAEIAKYAESIDVKGIGLYETDKDGHFVHIDTRPSKSFWYGQALKLRETFGGKVEEPKQEVEAETKTESVKPNNQEVSAKLILRKGDKGEEVKRLQERLKELGFDCLGADGDFGANTQKAVIDFQVERNLTPDGVCGPMTFAEMDAFVPYEAIVTASRLNVRVAPGLSKQVKTVVQRDSKLVIVYHKNNWGKLKDGAGWVSLDYVRKV